MVDRDKTNGCLPFSPQTHIMDAPPPQRPMSQACAKTSLPARRPMSRAYAKISPPVRRGLSLCPPAGNGAFSHKTNANSHKIPKIIRIRRTFFVVVILCCGRTHGLSPYEHGTGLFPSCTADGHRLKPLRTWNGSFPILHCGRTHGLSPYEHGTGLFPYAWFHGPIRFFSSPSE